MNDRTRKKLTLVIATLRVELAKADYQLLLDEPDIGRLELTFMDAEASSHQLRLCLEDVRQELMARR